MSKEMMEKKNDLITRAECVLNKAKEEKRELTEDEAAELAEIRDNVRKIIEFMKLDDDFRELGGMEKKPEPKEETEVTEEEKKKVVEEQEQRAFEAYIRGIVLNECAAGDGALTMTGGNALIPTTILNKIVK